MTFTKKMDFLSFEVSVGEERVYDMSSFRRALSCSSRFAGCTSGRGGPVTEVRVSESRNDSYLQTVVSEATNRIEAEMPNEIIQKRASGK